jgi:ABC-type Mn2+/Zn2+ transport system permease subunit/DNA-binding transcriptional ArsR family regulator
MGLLTSQSPVLTATVAAAAGAVAVELVRERGRTSGDIALALLFYGGISGGVFLVGLSPGTTNANLMTYLFGSPLTTSRDDLAVMAILGVGVLAVSLLLRPWLFAICHDEEYARVSGLPVRTLNVVLAITTAVTVTVAMRAVGLLLVSALMVVPVATAQLVSRGFRATQHAAMGLGMVAAGGGIWCAGRYDTASAAGARPGSRRTSTAPRRSRPRWCCPRDATVVGVSSYVAYEAAGELLRALAAPIRIAIVTELAGGERRVHELVDALGATQPLVSQHLRVLRGAGVVRGVRRGREIAYSLVDEHIAHIVTDAVSHAGESATTLVEPVDAARPAGR